MWIIYGLGVVIFSIKFFNNLAEILLRIQQNLKLKNKSFVCVLLSDKIVPHTFFNYLFFNKEEFINKQIPQEVIVHEEAHAIQLHSLDILFMEILQIIFWFNPLIYLAKNAIKLNHEFLADQSVIKNGIETSIYQRTLLAFSSNAEASNLANAFNYSSTRLTVFGKTFSFGKFGQVKKRFTVMKTHTSKKMIMVKTVLVIPLLALLLYSFSTKKEVSKLANSNTSDIITQPETSVLVQDIATKKMISEYNKLAKKYNALPKNERTISREELSLMVYIFDRMTKEQRERSEKFPEIIVPKNAPPPPMPTMENDLRGVIPPPPPPKSEHDRITAPHPASDMIAPPPIPPINEPVIITVVEDVPPPPSPPAPPIFEKLVADGAIFYYFGKIIEPEKARNLVEVQKSVNVRITYTDEEKPTVKLTDKKGND
nr:M56 family metallopeptidase [Gillisia sp. JM1]